MSTSWEAIAARVFKVEQRARIINAYPIRVPNAIEWCEQACGHALDGWQQDILLSPAHSVLMNCSRQVGKTEIVALKAAYRARYLKRHVTVLAPSWFQSNKVRMRAEKFLGPDQKYKTKNAFEMRLVEGGVIQALPGDRPDLSVRGEVIDDLIVDEASRVKDSLIAAASPTQATRPDFTETYLSTPAGKRGAFYKAWGDPHWEKYSIKAVDCERISKSFLAKERSRLGDVLFSQEYECQFVADSTAVLDPAAVSAMFATVREPERDWMEREEPNPLWDV